jgi:formamidopyrimidine-DNA glycosylase
MPELPEVETIVRSLAPYLTGRRIISAEFSCVRIMRSDAAATSRGLAGRRINGVRRRGKFILMDLEDGQCFAVHLGMTGKLLMNAQPGKHTHAVVTLDRGVLLYDDMRQFGRLELCSGIPARIDRLGPEPLEVAFEEFAHRLRARKMGIKALLLDQAFLRGVGNIYADEALFRARIHPLAPASSLRKQRTVRLYESIRKVLTEAIERRGSSVSDYVDTDGREGSFQQLHRVYQRTGEPCVVCGSRIKRILVAQRGTHYCPKCQKR